MATIARGQVTREDGHCGYRWPRFGRPLACRPLACRPCPGLPLSLCNCLNHYGLRYVWLFGDGGNTMVHYEGYRISLG